MAVHYGKVSVRYGNVIDFTVTDANIMATDTYIVATDANIVSTDTYIVATDANIMATDANIVSTDTDFTASDSVLDKLETNLNTFAQNSTDIEVHSKQIMAKQDKNILVTPMPRKG